MIGRIVTLVVALAFLPVAAAQAPAEPKVELEAISPEGFLSPETAAAMGTIFLRWSCSQPELLGRDRVSTATFVVEGEPAFAILSVAPLTVSYAPAEVTDCDDDAFIHEAESQVIVVVTRAAPAFVPFDVPFQVNLTLSPGAAATTADEWGPYAGRLTFTPDFLAGVEVLPDVYIQEGAEPDSDVAFNVRIQNLANGRATATFVLEHAAEGPMIEFTQPSPVTLDAAGEPGSSADVSLQVRIPQTAYRAGHAYPFKVLVTLGSADRPSTVEQQVVVLSVRAAGGGGAGGEAAGPSFAPMILALTLSFGIVSAIRRRT